MKSTHHIQAIFFDLDGTLRHSRPSFYQRFFDFADQNSLTSSPEARRESKRWMHYYWAASPELRSDREVFGEDEDSFWENFAVRYLRAFGCPGDQARQLAADLYHHLLQDYQSADWVPPDVIPTLKTLSESGYLLAVVSNRSDPIETYLEELGLRAFLQFTLTAGEADSWKPDPGIFQQALQRANQSPENTLFVGDNYYADILGARGAGLHPVLVDPEGLFPEAGCPAIQTVSDIHQVLAA